MTSNAAGRTLGYILRELVGELLYWPVWWYTTGLRLAWRRMQSQVIRMYDRLGTRYLFSNMGRPMYGDYTRSGRVISFFFRLLLVGWSLLVLSVWGLFAALLFLLWIVIVPGVLAMLVLQLLPVSS